MHISDADAEAYLQEAINEERHHRARSKDNSVPIEERAYHRHEADRLAHAINVEKQLARRAKRC